MNIGLEHLFAIMDTTMEEFKNYESDKQISCTRKPNKIKIEKIITRILFFCNQYVCQPQTSNQAL